jgi:hypothetical protein
VKSPTAIAIDAIREDERVKIVNHLRKAGDEALQTIANQRTASIVNRFIRALADEVELGKHAPSQQSSDAEGSK